MILIVGLGNTGKQYQNTRHNVGFIAVDFLAAHHNILWNIKPKFHAELAQGGVSGCKILLAKPLTYMNICGPVVQAISAYYGIKSQQIFVIHDDIDLKMGQIKYKLGGGNGGHNGLKSLDQHIENNYHRIRIGIGRPFANQDVADYVLGSFPSEDSKIIVNSIKTIADNLHFLLLQQEERFKNQVALNQMI